MHYFILSIFLLNFAIADPERTQKFINSIKSGQFTYNSDSGIVRCSIEEGIDGWLKLKPNMSDTQIKRAVESYGIRYHGPTGPRLILFALDDNTMLNLPANAKPRLL